MNQIQPRGIRNNNPGNIRWGENWQGLKKDGKERDSSFCVFESPEYGIRALAKILINYKKTLRLKNHSINNQSICTTKRESNSGLYPISFNTNRTISG